MQSNFKDVAAELNAKWDAAFNAKQAEQVAAENTLKLIKQHILLFQRAYYNKI